MNHWLAPAAAAVYHHRTAAAVALKTRRRRRRRGVSSLSPSPPPQPARRCLRVRVHQHTGEPSVGRYQLPASSPARARSIRHCGAACQVGSVARSLRRPSARRGSLLPLLVYLYYHTQTQLYYHRRSGCYVCARARVCVCMWSRQQ